MMYNFSFLFLLFLLFCFQWDAEYGLISRVRYKGWGVEGRKIVLKGKKIRSS